MQNIQVTKQPMQGEVPPQAGALPATVRDPKSIFYQKEGLRRAIIFSYWTIILLAVPLWWYLTSIERLALPSGRVQQLAQNRLELPVPICIEGEDIPRIDRIQVQLTANMNREPQRWKGLAPKLVGSTACAKTSGEDIYSVAFKADAGAYIHRRQLHLPPDTSASTVVEILSSLLVPYSSSSGSEHRVMQYSPHYRLAFSLLNEDAAAGEAITDWSIKTVLNNYINPILHRLSALHNFTIESQIQFHAPLAFSPQQLDGSWGVTPADLSVFVNSAEWTLSSSSSNDPVIHFILFVPSADRRPLRILADDEGTISPSTAFIVPQWGGIIIHNPSSISSGPLPDQDTLRAFGFFASQLQSLLGVSPLPPGIRSSAVVSDWQLDALTRRRTLENAQGSQDTLVSIVKLVDQIENMPVHADVRDDVEDALGALQMVYGSAHASLEETFKASAHALGLASRAFFNPGMLALLYFPAEHTYAVYTPLFASALIPLLVAALREFLAWKRERKAVREGSKEKNVE